MIKHKYDVADLAVANPRAVARALSEVENATGDSRDLSAALYAKTGNAHIVGVTGVPGSGKSTLVHALTKEFRTEGKTVAILAIDPTSPFSGGAILGDRVRMSDLSTDAGVFIRSVATRGALGGLASAALDMVDVFDAAGFDLILIETVGVGQDEVDIAMAAHTVVVVSAPGLGDDIQAIKAGVLEIADIHVVSKSDKPDAARTAADLRAMLKLGGAGRNRHGWTVPVIQTSAELQSGLDTLSETIAAHGEHLIATEEGQERRVVMARHRLRASIEELLRRKLDTLQSSDERIAQIAAGEVAPALQAQQVLRDLLGSLD